MTEARITRAVVHQELDRVRLDLHVLAESASREDLRRGTNGTRWNNRQLLFHMLFGYLVVRTLLPLVRTLGRLPDQLGAVFARLLNVGTRPFHVVNYFAACGGALIFTGARMTRRADRTIDSLQRRLDRETDAALALGMNFPPGWDPFFKEWMTLLEVYHYATQHYDFHRRQLTLGDAS
jgi:hypothetical protein